MSWTDKKSIEVINYLKEKAKIKTFVETGTFKGINSRLHSKNFENVITCEVVNANWKKSKDNLKPYKNVVLVKGNSSHFLKRLSLGTYIFYLDAHFYDENLPDGEEKFVVLKELDNLTKFKNSIIIIHDFCNGLGHITYDGIKLDMDLVRSRLNAINKNFYFYTNTLVGCDIVKPHAQDIVDAGLEVDFDTLDNLDYAWTFPRLTYRGFLYCLPFKLTNIELKKLGLRTWT